ncbi:unnamed protein product, partial [Linum tenue]
MKSKGSQGKRARAPIPNSNVLSVSEAECDDIGMDSSSGEEMEVEMDASTSNVDASDHTGSASTHINSPMPKGRRLTSKVWVQFRRYKKDGLFKSSCIKCGKTYASKSRNNGTSALRNHMSKPCSDGKGTAQQLLNTLRAELGEGDESMSGSWKFDQAAIRKGLTYMIVVDE